MPGAMALPWGLSEHIAGAAGTCVERLIVMFEQSRNTSG